MFEVSKCFSSETCSKFRYLEAKLSLNFKDHIDLFLCDNVKLERIYQVTCVSYNSRISISLFLFLAIDQIFWKLVLFCLDLDYSYVFF